jgi:hypothetical protein
MPADSTGFLSCFRDFNAYNLKESKPFLQFRTSEQFAFIRRVKRLELEGKPKNRYIP